jgi:hypothetical protein
VIRAHDVVDAVHRNPPILHLVDERLGASALRSRASVRAEEEQSARRDDVLEESRGVVPAQRRRNVHELRSHVIEASWRFPEERVADEDPLSPLWEPPPRQLDQSLRDVEAVWLERPAVLAPPPSDALHEESVRAADVEEGAVGLDRRHDRPPKALPISLVPAEAGLLPRIGAREVPRLAKRALLEEKSLVGRLELDATGAGHGPRSLSRPARPSSSVPSPAARHSA